MQGRPAQSHPWATVGSGKRGDYEWFDFYSEIGNAAGKYLPHLRKEGAVYFVTTRTEDSIPAPVMQQWEADRARWLASHPFPHDSTTNREYHRRFTERMHRYLDDCLGACPFRLAEARNVLAEVILHSDGKTYALDEYVIMPNHIHVLVSPHTGIELSDVTQAWKRVSAHRLNRLLNRTGQLWQYESWDHGVRSPEHLEHFRRYIDDNPKRLP